MALIRIILMLAAWGSPALTAGAAEGTPEPESFLLALPDIPLMPGFSEDAAAAVLFDKPGGRILAARLNGCVAAAEARAYYGATLPQLGWLPADRGLSSPALVYLREGERLTLEFVTSGGGPDGCLELRFLLSPVPAPADAGK